MTIDRYHIHMFIVWILCFTLTLTSCQKSSEGGAKSSTEEKKEQNATKTINVDEKIVSLSNDVVETSGLMNDEGKLWTHNDSGHKGDLFQIDPNSGDILRKVHLDKVKNNDWEEIALDSQYIYVGDIGNNAGKRKKLRINRLPKNLLYQGTDVIEEQEVKIKFFYPNQPEKLSNHNHDYDSEAFLPLGDRIYIFTKNWKTQTCDLYSIPNEEGEWEAQLISNFDVNGLITSATFLGGTDQIVLLGYMKGKLSRSFTWLLSDYGGDDFFSGSKVRYNLNIMAQTEAIVDKGGSSVYITAEGGNGRKPRLFELTFP